MVGGGSLALTSMSLKVCGPSETYPGRGWHHLLKFRIFLNHIVPVLLDDIPIVWKSGVVRDWDVNSVFFLSIFHNLF